MPVRKFLSRPQGTGFLHWVHSFSLHVATGAIAVAAHYAAMYGFVQAGVPGVPASALGFGAGALTRFALSYWRVFAPSRGCCCRRSCTWGSRCGPRRSRRRC
jgi:hypothetical protein